MNAVVTGASKGIGKEIAKRLCREGASVFICSRHAATLQQSAEELQAAYPDSRVYFTPADLGKKDEAELLAAQVAERFPSLDLLVNNAGIFLPGLTVNEPEGLLESLLDTNVMSAYRVSRLLLPLMLPQKRGHIFNISSVAGLQAYENGGSYSISKFALQGFSKNLREELKTSGIKVTTINPGATMSDSWSGSGVPEDRIMRGSDIADMIWAIYNLSPQAVVEDIVMRPLLGDL